MEPEVLEAPPIYVNCTPEQWAEAKATARRERLEPFFWFMEPYAAAACDSQMTNGGYIEPVVAAQFRDIIDAKGYKPVYTDKLLACRRDALKAERARADEVRAAWEKEQREKRPVFRFQSLQQAAMLLSPQEYNEYCLSQEGQLLAQQYNKALYGLF
jgi:hypothetical protein